MWTTETRWPGGHQGADTGRQYRTPNSAVRRPDLRTVALSAGLPTSHNRYHGADIAVGGQRFLPILLHRILGTSSTTETFDGLPPAPDCDAVATEVASTIYVDRPTNEERLLTVEIDGCRRVIADGYAPMQASDELLVSFR